MTSRETESVVVVVEESTKEEGSPEKVEPMHEPVQEVESADDKSIGKGVVSVEEKESIVKEKIVK